MTTTNKSKITRYYTPFSHNFSFEDFIDYIQLMIDVRQIDDKMQNTRYYIYMYERTRVADAVPARAQMARKSSRRWQSEASGILLKPIGATESVCARMHAAARPTHIFKLPSRTSDRQYRPRNGESVIVVVYRPFLFSSFCAFKHRKLFG